MFRLAMRALLSIASATAELGAMRVRRRVLSALLLATAIVLPACEHVTIGPPIARCDICGGRGPR